ncbi:putative ketohexokinase [Apodospora peruviana]|uniref:Ketohexokinase n=1 Tax=Apodospora peruviana TaxID=516989 RepID=A0AAE0IIA1_9PEZI|nr:putative ketohexokinase [Apodospora peruviana]
MKAAEMSLDHPLPGNGIKHLILIGACYLDTILTVPHFPEEDSKLRATSLQVRRGGNCPNTLEVLQQLLLSPSSSSGEVSTTTTTPRLYLVATLPGRQTTATRRILSSFGVSSSIDFSHCLYREGYDEPASSYIIRSEDTQSRTIVNFNELPEMTEDEFVNMASGFAGRDDEQGGGGSDCWWHFEGRIPSTTLRCIHHLRKYLPESKISVEVEKPNRQGLEELASEADVVFYSRSWAELGGIPGQRHV